MPCLPASRTLANRTLSTLALLLAAAAAALGQIANDVCADALPLSFSTTPPASINPAFFTVSNVGATASGLPSGCTPGNTNPSNSVDSWYVMTPTAPLLRVRHDRIGLTIAVYESCADATAGVALRCVGPSSDVVLAVTPSQPLYFRFLTSQPIASLSYQANNVTVANDDCAGAILTSGTTWSQTFIRDLAAPSTQADCDGDAGQLDLWYRFTAPSTGAGALSNSVSGDQLFGFEYQVLDGTCGNFTSLQCGTFGGGTDVITGLTPGAGYYLRLYTTRATLNARRATIQFRPVSPNASCAAALPAPVRPPGTGCAIRSFLNDGLTGANVYYYRWTATRPALLVTSSKAKVTASTSCTQTLNPYSSFTPNINGVGELGVLSGWEIGDEVILSYFPNPVANNASLPPGACLEAFTYPTPPPNDEYTAPVTLTVDAAPLAQNFGAARANATPFTRCDEDIDLWYAFTAPSSGIVSFRGDYASQPRADIYATAPTGTITAVACNERNVTGLTPGETYLMRVTSLAFAVDEPFTVGLEAGNAPPADNITCATAADLVVGKGNGCSASSRYAFDQTFSAGSPQLWYRWRATSNRLRFTVEEGSGTITAGILSGDCAVNFPIANLRNGQTASLTLGQEYLIRVTSPKQPIAFCFAASQVGPRPIAEFAGCSGPIGTKITGTSPDNAADFVLPDGSIVARIFTTANLDSVYVRGFDDGPNGTARVIPKTSSFDAGRSVGIESLLPPDAPVSVSLYLTAEEVNDLIAADAGASSTDDLIVAHVTGSNGCSPFYQGGGLATPVTVAAYGTGHRITFTVSSFSEFFVVGGSAPVPVELVDFTAEEMPSGAVELAWTTASERGASHFDVERLPAYREGQAGPADVIGRVEAAGEADRALRYAFTDAEALPEAYYRLRAVDLDGSTQYSSLVYVRTASAAATGEAVAVHPNFARAGTVLRVRTRLEAASDRPSAYGLYDLRGRLVRSVSVTAEGHLPTDGLAAGTYLLRRSDRRDGQPPTRIVLF